MGLAKVHCGATPPSVMVLFILYLGQIPTFLEAPLYVSELSPSPKILINFKMQLSLYNFIDNTITRLCNSFITQFISNILHIQKKLSIFPLVTRICTPVAATPLNEQTTDRLPPVFQTWPLAVVVTRTRGWQQIVDAVGAVVDSAVAWNGASRASCSPNPGRKINGASITTKLCQVKTDNNRISNVQARPG